MRKNLKKLTACILVAAMTVMLAACEVPQMKVTVIAAILVLKLRR